MTFKLIKEELKKVLDLNYRQNLMKKYDLLEEKLGGIGASTKTAQLIFDDLK